MKINDKSLIHLAANLEHIDKQGFLFKRGEINRSLQRRWFVLTGNLFFYSEKQYSREPIGVIVLEGCKIHRDTSNNFGFVINFPGEHTRIWTFSAESKDEMESWMQALAYASYNNMRELAYDLERQINELKKSSAAMQQQSALTAIDSADNITQHGLPSQIYQDDQGETSKSVESSANRDSNRWTNLLNLVEDHYCTDDGFDTRSEDVMNRLNPDTFIIDRRNSDSGIVKGKKSDGGSFLTMHQQYGDQIWQRYNEWEDYKNAIVSEQLERKNRKEQEEIESDLFF